MKNCNFIRSFQTQMVPRYASFEMINFFFLYNVACQSQHSLSGIYICNLILNGHVKSKDLSEPVPSQVPVSQSVKSQIFTGKLLVFQVSECSASTSLELAHHHVIYSLLFQDYIGSKLDLTCRFCALEYPKHPFASPCIFPLT